MAAVCLANPVVANDEAVMTLKSNQNFMLVSGLGGQSIRSWNEGLRSASHWYLKHILD